MLPNSQLSKAIQSRLLDALTQRSNWEQRQRVWYEMSRDGLKRRNKPFPGAANLHLPIADNAVEKLKPYYVNSVFSRQLLASFTPLGQAQGDACAAAAQALDWKLRKESNFPRAFAHLNHLMLVCGRALLKCRWDYEARGGRGCLAFEAVDPLYFIAEAEQDDPQEMDLFAHVKQISVAKYRRMKGFIQSEELINLLRGGENQAAQWKEQEKEVREGLTSSTNKELIILWETYERVQEGFLVRTFGPGQPDRPVRKEFVLPLKWQGERLQPFVSVQCEMTEQGFYASRGVVEKVSPFEAYGTKLWNQKADWLEYCRSPLFERDPQAVHQNTANLKLAPGDCLPPGIKPATMPPPPFALDEELNTARQLAEESAQVPDFGVTPEGNAAEKRTATEMQYIGSFASQGIQYKAWISGLFEGEIYKRAWALLVANAGKEISFFSARERKVLPKQALTDNYLIEPDSMPDAWNKTQRVQRSIARFQMFKGHPNVNQEELVKSVLEDDDPRLVKRLFISSGTKAANEAEDEAIEIGILLEGYPASVMPGEDHVTRLRMLFGKLQQLSMMAPPQTPEELNRMVIGRQRMQEHIGQHLALLQQENPALARQFTAAIGVLDPAGPDSRLPIANSQGGAQSISPGPVVPGVSGPESIGSGLPGAHTGQPALQAI